MFRRGRQVSRIDAPASPPEHAQFLNMIGEGRPTPKTEEEAAAAIHAGLRQAYSQLRDVMTANYEVVRSLHRVRVDGQVADRYIVSAMPDVENDLAERGIGAGDAPVASGMLRSVRDYFARMPANQEPLERFRRSLGAHAKQARHWQDTHAATLVRQLFDNAVSHCVERSALAKGSVGDAQRWLQASATARQARRELYETFEPHGPRDVAGRIIQDLATHKRRPRQVLESLVGNGPYGSHRPAPYVAQRLKRAFRDDPYAWHCARALAWLRLARSGLSVEIVEAARYENADLTDVFFTEDEQLSMEEFAVNRRKNKGAPIAREL